MIESKEEEPSRLKDLWKNLNCDAVSGVAMTKEGTEICNSSPPQPKWFNHHTAFHSHSLAQR